MILSREQAKRFERLYGGLVKFMFTRFQTVGDLLGIFDDNDRFDAFGSYLQEMIWGPDGDLTLIDEYIYDEVTLSASDIVEVESWKSGLFGTFAVHREGSETIFVRDGCAFVVRGIMHELDRGMAMPASAETVILPFDGLITYGMLMMTNPLDRHLSSARQELRTCLEQGRVARTDDEYERLVGFVRKGGLGSVFDEPLEGQHRSEFADLSWKERMRVFDDRVRDLEEAAWAVFMDERMTPGKPTTSLTECVMRLTKPEIVALARRVGVDGPLTKMRKAELAEAYAAQVDIDPAATLERYLPLRFTALENLQLLLDNAGRIDMDLSDFATRDDLPVPDRPVTWLFRNGSGYSLVMPDRFLEAFCALPASELSAWIERGRTLEVISRRISTMVEVKGVVDMQEVAAQVRELIGDESLTSYLPPLMDRADLRMVNFRFVELQGHEGFFVVNEMLCLDEHSVGEFATLRDPAAVEAYLKRSQTCPPCDFDSFGDGLDYLAWARSHASYRALVSYLDGRVPDGADDRTWAVDYADEVAARARATLGADDDFELMRTADLELTNEQRGHVGRLISDLMQDVPLWASGGWSTRETLQLFGDLMGDRMGFTGRTRPKPKPKPKPKTKARSQKRGRARKKRRR